MRNEVIIVCVLILTLLFVGTICAYSFDIDRKCSGRKQFKLNLYSESGNVNGAVIMTKGQWARASALRLTPYEPYTFVHMTSEENVTCINKNKATRNGAVHIAQFEFDYSCMTKADMDGTKGYFAIIPSSDVDCFSHKIIG